MWVGRSDQWPAQNMDAVLQAHVLGQWLWVGMLGLGGDFGTFMDWELKGYGTLKHAKIKTLAALLGMF